LLYDTYSSVQFAEYQDRLKLNEFVPSKTAQTQETEFVSATSRQIVQPLAAQIESTEFVQPLAGQIVQTVSAQIQEAEFVQSETAQIVQTPSGQSCCTFRKKK